MCWSARPGSGRSARSPSPAPKPEIADRGPRRRRHRGDDRPVAAIRLRPRPRGAGRRSTRTGAHDVVVNLQGDFPTMHGRAAARRDHAAFGPRQTATSPPWWPPIDHAAEAEANTPSVVKAACVFERGRATSPGRCTSRACPNPLGRRPALASYRHLRLPPRRPGCASCRCRKARWRRREKLEQLRALEDGMRIVCARIEHGPFGVDTPADLERARAELALRERG